MQILVACTHCQSQWNVSGLKTHSSVHCRCGKVLEVPERRVHEARLVRCASCGSVRNKGGENCEYCGARFSAVDKGWGSMCPGCFCRLPNDARFCVECGLKINPKKLDLKPSDMLCPRCKCNLQVRQVEQIELQECAACAGLWLPVEAFELIVKNKETMGLARSSLGRKRTMKFELSQEEQVRYVPCPKCKSLMNRRNFGNISGVIIDTCRDCGVWLDNQELNRVIQFIEAGGLEKSREHEAREREHNAKMRTQSVPTMPMDVNLAPLSIARRSTKGDLLGSLVGRAVFEIAKAFLK